MPSGNELPLSPYGFSGEHLENLDFCPTLVVTRCSSIPHWDGVIGDLVSGQDFH